MANADAHEPKDRGWTPYLIGGGLIVLAVVIVTLVTRSPAPHHPGSSTTTTTIKSGVQLYRSAVVLQQGQSYGLDSLPPAADQCTDCIQVEPVIDYGMALSSPLGLQIWHHTAPPTFEQCSSSLQAQGLPAASLYVPPTYTTGAKPGTYFCAFSNDGNVLRMRYDGAGDGGNTFRFDVTAWTS